MELFLQKHIKLLCFSLSILVSQSLFSVNETENNGTILTANQINQGETLIGNIGVSGDADDYFRTVLDNDGTLKFNFTFNSFTSGGDLFLYVYNKGQSLIGTKYLYNTGVGAGADSLTIYCRMQDTIYYRISATAGFDYEIQYNCSPSGILDAEPNNSFQTALPFNQTESVSGRISYTSVAPDVDDYFVTVLPQQGTFQYALSYTNTSGSSGADFYTYLYNRAGSLIGSSYNYNQPVGTFTDTIRVYCREADSLYIRISSSGCFSYTYSYQVITSGIPDVEPNNSFATATTVLPASTTTGRIGYTSTTGSPLASKPLKPKKRDSAYS